jgi:hypothetical protein
MVDRSGPVFKFSRGFTYLEVLAETNAIKFIGIFLEISGNSGNWSKHKASRVKTIIRREPDEICYYKFASLIQG